ncbi:caspase family protein [Sphingobacterium sp. SGR-19]|uniref:caspase family protein n=1 Tax=Sphingobacterium sp. SGR-19 TaxID=2710886 RepID=UPI0013EC98C1|nr:caspase family protein [Sphingobacterium sp. SGR-19]NGM64708.1 hypothetical protein [Sphingobacterium sp. SGR-19]
MKQLFFYLSLLLGVGLLSFSQGTAQTKRALVIAIGEYKDHGPGKSWSSISSVNDTAYILPALRRQGFTGDDTRLLLNEQATMTGIRSAFDHLVRDAGPGDVVTIHISAHGAQIEDDNGDEIDGLDETIVSYGAQLPPRTATTDFETLQLDYFRDDEFGGYMQQLRERLDSEGDIVVFMDNCHSGSGTRGTAIVRGGAPPLLSPKFDAGRYRLQDEGVFQEPGSRGGGDNLASYVVISASRAEELNYETRDEQGRGVGTLTLAVSKALENLVPGTTYRNFYAQVQATVNQRAARQNPVIEGTGLDRELFGGDLVQQTSYFEVSRIAPSGTDIEIRAGLLNGLADSAVVAIYPSGTTSMEAGKPIAEGLVTRASNFSATVKLDAPLGLRHSERAKAWVFLKSKTSKLSPVVLAFADPNPTRGGISNHLSAAEIETYRAALADMPIVSFEGPPDLALVRGQYGPVLKMAGDGQDFVEVADEYDLQERIRDFTRYQFLRSLYDGDNGMLDIQLIPVVNGRPDTTAIPAYMDLGQYAFAPGDEFVLRIKNKTRWPVYVNVLDLQPNGVINAIFPNTQVHPPITPEELRIEGYGERLFDQFPIAIGPPYGIETFLFFASRELINLEQVATPKSVRNGARGVLTDLESLVSTAFDEEMTSRGGTSSSKAATSDGSISSVVFKIVEKR